MNDLFPEWKTLSHDLDPLSDEGVSSSFMAIAQLDEAGRVLMVNAAGEEMWQLEAGMRIPRSFLYTLRKEVPEESGFFPLDSPLGRLQVLHLQQQGGWLFMSLPELSDPPTSETSESSTFKSLIEKIPICILRLDADGTVRYANEESGRITGYPAQDVIGRPFLLEILHPEDRWKLTKALRAIGEMERNTLGVRFQRQGEEEQTRFAEIHLYRASEDAEAQVEALFLDVTDQSEVDEDLFLSESLYRAFLEQTPTGVLHLDETGLVTFENHRFRQIMGESADSAWIGQNIYAMRPFGDDLDGLMRNMLREGSEFGNLQTRYPQSGIMPKMHLLLHGAPIRHPDGQIVGGVLLVEDVTAQKQQEVHKEREKAYLYAESLLREALFDHVGQSSFLEKSVEILAQVTDADRVHVLLRADSENVYHTNAVWPSDRDEKTPFESLNKVDYPVLARIAADREPLYIRQHETTASDAFLLLEKSGAEEALWVPFFENGRPFGFIVFEHFSGASRDWTSGERAFIEKLIHTFEALWGRIIAEVRYNQTVAAIDECLFNFEFTPEGLRSYTFVTEQIEGLIGYPADTLLNQETGRIEWVDQVVDSVDREAVMQHDRRLREGLASEVTYRINHRDGTHRWLRESASAHRDSSRRVTVGGILIDVTEQKSAESDLINAKRAAESANQLKSAFLATMSHEIRTPLGAVNGFAELLSRELAEVEEKNQRPMPAQVTEFVTAIRDNSQRLLTLVNDLFDLSNLEMGGMSIRHISVSLHEVISKATSRHAIQLSQKGVELKLNLAQPEPVVVGDPQRILQVLDNLLENAAKFTEEGAVTVLTARQNDVAMVEITDTGVGMSEEYVAHLFTPFMQEDRRQNRRFKGTGLGLALAKRVLELMKGRIEVESQKGKGSTFRIFLPLAQS